MPVTRRRAAAAARVVVADDDDDERTAAIDISSDSDEGSEPSSEEEETSDEDFVEISDSDSDSETGGGEGSGDEDGEEAEAEGEQMGADRGEAACSKITDLLRNGRSLEGIKLVECKAYLKKIGLSQTGDIATCIDRIMLHWRFKDGNPEKIYPRSSFCINCKGDVCRGDAVLFKQKVYEKSGKRHSKCIGKHIVAGKVIKESYGKEKQQHTFTIQVFWSRGVGKLLPLSLLLVKGRNLYRMMTFRQPWPNEAERLRALEEKHNRGDAARRIRSLNRQPTGNTLKGKKTMERKRHQARSERSDRGSNIIGVDKSKKRSIQSSNFDMPNKRSKKRGQLPSIGTCNSGRKAKKNRTHFGKSIGAGSREKMQNTCHSVPLNTEVAMNKRNPRSEQMSSISQAQFEGRSNTLSSQAQASCGILAGLNHASVERHQRPPPLREVGNIWLPHPGGNSVLHPLVERHQRRPPLREVGDMWLPHPGGNSVACPNRPYELFNTTMGLRPLNAIPHAPPHFRQSNQERVTFPSSDMSETACYLQPEVSYGIPYFGYPR